VPFPLAARLAQVEKLGEGPKLKPDLIMRRQHTAEGSVLVLKDPVRNQFFRFREVEGFILEQLDGKTSPERIRASTQEKFGISLSTENLDEFIRKLDHRGLIAAGALQARPQATRGRRVHGDAFYLRFRAFNPDQLLARWVGGVRFFFV